MTATLITGESVAGTGSIVTTGVDTTGANFLLCVLATFNAPVTGNVSDSKSNSWTWRTQYGPDADFFVQVGYVVDPTVGSGHTLTNNSGYHVLFFYSFSGMDTASSVYDTENGAGDATNTGSITPDESGELLVTAWCGTTGSGDSSTVDGGFSIEDLVAFNNGVNPGAGVAFDNTYDSVSAVSCEWTDVGSADNALTIAAFKLAGAATLTVQDGQHTQSGDVPHLSQDQFISVADGQHTQTGDSPHLSQNQFIIVADGEHTQEGDSPHLSQNQYLIVADGEHTQTGDSPHLSQNQFLVVADGEHIHTGDTITLNGITYLLVVQDGEHEHVSDGIIIDTDEILLVRPRSWWPFWS